jgi:predicted PurR-regulated permease PerM
MKKITLYLLTALLTLVIIPLSTSAATDLVTPVTSLTKETPSAEMKALIIRVDEIKAMDKSTLSSSERKALRKEMRDAKRMVNQTHNSTVYISGGLLVLIILLIILL